jgi:uncharacterized RDD family membrane protein YckC
MQNYLPKRLRLLNWIIDTIISFIAFIIIVSLWAPHLLNEGQNTTLKLSFLCFNFLYYLLFEAILHRTPAKYLTNSTVTDDEGDDISLIRIIIRTLFRYLPFEPFVILFRKDKKGLHDIVSGISTTKTIKTI